MNAARTCQRLRRATAAALLCACAWAAPPPPAKTERAVLRIPFWSESGPGLETAHLRANVNGAEARVSRVLGPADDLLILVVLDLAGDLSRVDPARDALVDAIRKLPEKTTVALLRAQDGLRVLEDPGADREAIASQIQSLPISGRAGLLDTVETALQLGDGILTKSAVRLAVFYITDSLVGNYREDFTNPVVNSSDSRDMSRRFPEALIKERIQQMLARTGRTRAPLFISHLNYENDRLNEAYQTGLLELASATGGQADFCKTLADIPSSIARMVEAILAHQSVEIDFKPEKARHWEVQLAAEGRTLRHRTRYLPGGGKQ